MQGWRYTESPAVGTERSSKIPYFLLKFDVIYPLTDWKSSYFCYIEGSNPFINVIWLAITI